MYTHLTRDDRAVIAQGLRDGETRRQIGARLCRDASSITRDINRNGEPNGTYRADRAQQRADARRAASKYDSRKLENDSELAATVEHRLHPLISPEVIAHDLPLVHETIYAWIRRSRRDLTKQLPRHGKRRRPYGSKRQGRQGWQRHVRSIHIRPIPALLRSEVGHFEGDTIRGKQEHRAALLTHTDRKSRFEVAQKIENEGCDAGHAAVVRNTHLRRARSFTYDRGGTFALWRMIERDTSASVFFADAYTPSQRGTNEHHNERLRRVYPKGTDFATVSQRHINRTVWLMNHTKRKCLNWRTPCEVYGRCCTSS